MPGELERLQIVIEADASGVAPAAQAAGNAVEQMGQRTRNAAGMAQKSISAYKRAFTEAQRAARLESQRSAASAALDKTARAIEAETRKLREYKAVAASLRYKGLEQSDGYKTNAAKIAAQEARLQELDARSETQAQKYGQIEDAMRIQSEIAEMTRQRAAEAQAAAAAAAQETGATTAQTAAAESAAESERALAQASREAAASAQGARSAASSQAQAAQETAHAARDAAQSVRAMRAEAEASRRGTSIFSSIGRAMRSMLLIRSVTGTMRHFVRWLGQAAMANAQFKAAVDSIRGNLISAFAPIYDAIIPWLTSLANAIANVVGWISRLVNLFSGGNHSATEKTLSGIGGAAGGAAKQVRGLLAQFDELNTLERENGSGGGGGGGSGSGSGGTGAQVVDSYADAWKTAIAAEHPVLVGIAEIATNSVGILESAITGTQKIIRALNPALAERLSQNAQSLSGSFQVWKGLDESGTLRQINESYKLRSRADAAREDMRPYDISGYASMSVDEFERAQAAAGKQVKYSPKNILREITRAIIFPDGLPTVEDVLSEEGKAWYRSLQEQRNNARARTSNSIAEIWNALLHPGETQAAASAARRPAERFGRDLLDRAGLWEDAERAQRLGGGSAANGAGGGRRQADASAAQRPAERFGRDLLDRAGLWDAADAVQEAGKRAGNSLADIWRGLLGKSREDPLAQYDLITPALEEIQAQGEKTTAALRVGAGETARGVEDVAEQFALAEQAVSYFGLTGSHTWEEMLGYVARMQEETGAAQERVRASEELLRMSLSEPLMEAQEYAAAAEAEFAHVENRINGITAAARVMEKEMLDAKARAEEEIAKALYLYDAQTGKIERDGKNALNGDRTDAKIADTRAGRYDTGAAASAPSHAGAGTRPLSDIWLDQAKDAVQQNTQKERASVTLEIDGRVLGSVMLNNFTQLSRINGKEALTLY